MLRLLADVGQNTAVHIQDMTVDEVGSVAGQEHGGTHQILGSTPAGSGGLGDDELIEGMTALKTL